MAKPFKFSLQKVLDYRLQLEDQAKLALAEAERAHQDGLAWLASLEERLEQHEADYFAKPVMTSAELWLWRGFKERLLLDIDNAKARLRELAQAVQARRAELTARAKDRKLLEKLKENQAEKHTREAALKEQGEYDEMATIRHERQDF